MGFSGAYGRKAAHCYNHGGPPHPTPQQSMVLEVEWTQLRARRPTTAPSMNGLRLGLLSLSPNVLGTTSGHAK